MGILNDVLAYKERRDAENNALGNAIPQAVAAFIQGRQQAVENQQKSMLMQIQAANAGFRIDGNQLVKDESLGGTKPVYGFDKTEGTLKKITDIPKDAVVQQTGQSNFGSASEEELSSVVDGMAKGTQNPNLTAYSRNDRTRLSALAEKRGINLNQFAGEYNATQKFLQTKNSIKQVQLRQGIDSVQQSVKHLRDLNEEFKRTGWTPANKAEIVLAMTGTNPAKREIATKYLTQLNVLTDEMGQVFMGGNSPTDRALKLAGEIFNKDFGFDQMNAALDTVDTNLQFRLNAMDSTEPSIVGGNVQNQNMVPRADSVDEDFSAMSREELQAMLAELEG